jgi:very-short-patch-repair endonuclease
MAVDRPGDSALRRIARGHNGCLTWDELLGTGLTPSMVKTRVRRGELVWMYHRVYALGDPALIPLCRETAALLSFQRGAVLSHRSAAAVWGLTGKPSGLVHVTLVGHRRPREGVRDHRVKRLERADIRTRSNVRLTSPSRTVIDLATEASPMEVEQAIADGLAQRLLTERELMSAMSRIPGNHRGAAAVRALFARDGGAVMTRSGGERKLRALIRSAGLPQPISNATVDGFEVDFYWPEHNLVVELDAYAYHAGRRVVERDRRKDQVLKTLGVTVLRVTGTQLHHEPFAVIARLAQVLVGRAA